MAGKDFFLDFKKRNPDLALRTSEATRKASTTYLCNKGINFKIASSHKINDPINS